MFYDFFLILRGIQDTVYSVFKIVIVYGEYDWFLLKT